MTKPRLLFLLALATTPACWSTFLPGRCDQTSDCDNGLVCNLEPTPEGHGRCVSPDAGDTGQGGRGGAGEAGGGGRDGTVPDTGAAGSAGDAGRDGGSDATDANAAMEVAPEVKSGCSWSSECPAATPICDPAGVCRRCDANTVSSTACTTADASKPACGPDGQCIVCASSADCKTDATKPICDVANQKCVACTSDGQCVSKLGANPGVCMAHQDGRCATDAETYYVSNQAGCSDTAASAGTTAAPFCSLDPAANSAGGNRSVVVVRGPVTAAGAALGASSEVTLVGQQSGVIASVSPTAIQVASGKRVYVRGLTVTAVVGIGISAGAGSTLRLERVTVSNSSKGGIQLGGAAFDISNSTISGNGPAFQDTTAWGGILVQFPPVGGLARLSLVTVDGNKSVGIVCSNAVSGTGVFATGNAAGDVIPTCGFPSCAAAGPACGAQP